MNRFGDIRRVRLSHSEVRTWSDTRARFAKLFVLFESSSELLSIYARSSGCRRAAELVQKTIQKHRSAVASRGLKSLGLKN
eukprot:6406025-Pyramimonas_sp.AAC.1